MKKAIAIAVILLLLMSLPLTACGRRQEGGESGAQNTDLTVKLFERKSLTVPAVDVSILWAVRTGDSIVLCGKDGQGVWRFYRMDTSEFIISAIEGLTADNIETVDGLSDGSAMMTYYDVTGTLTAVTVEPDNSYSQSPVKLPEEWKDAYLHDIKMSETGFVISTMSSVFAIDAQGNLLREIEFLDGEFPQLVRGADDSLLLVCSGNNGTKVQKLASDLSVIEEYSIDEKFEGFINGGSEGELLAEYTGDIICRVDLQTGSIRGYVNTYQTHLAPACFVLLSEDCFFSTYQSSPVLWTVSDGQEKCTITLATCSDGDIYDNALKSAVRSFNEDSVGYYIEIVDYSAKGDAGRAILNTEIISGKTPDIYDLYSLDMSNYYSKGLLCDLKPFFEADSDIDYRDYVESVFKLLEHKDGLYELVPSFSVTTMFAPASIIQTERLTVDEFLRLADVYGPEKLFGGQMARNKFLASILVYCGDEYINTQEKKSSFDSENFIRLLEFTKLLPEEEPAWKSEEAAIYYGDRLFMLEATNDIVDTLLVADTVFHGDWREVGFLSDTNPGITMTPTVRLGMAADSEHQEGVWAFFKYLLDSSYQWKVEALPVKKDVLEQRIEGSVLAHQEPIKIGLVYEKDGQWLDTVIEGGCATDEIEAQALDIIERISAVNGYDQTVLDIVLSEAARFFAGNKNVEETAASMQSRIGIYLSEQYG